MIRWLSLIVAIAILSAGDTHAETIEPAMVERHRGVVFASVEPTEDYQPDIPLVSSAASIERLKTALTRLELGAPGIALAIDRLRAAGDVVIVYHPVFPTRQTARVTAAAFYPQFFNPDNADDTFLVIFGRYGIKWPIDDIALVIAHELAGHGIQHLEKRLPAPQSVDTDPFARRADFECEANLYTEQAIQQLGTDTTTGPHATHRRALERHWCKPFIDWLSRTGRPTAAEWQKRHPDVSVLLPELHRFIAETAESGIHAAYSSQSLDAARAAVTALQDRSPASLFLQGRQALNAGDIDTAVALLEQAADRRFNRANILLAEIMLTHAPSGPFTEQARIYLEAARGQGSMKAAAMLKVLNAEE